MKWQPSPHRIVSGVPTWLTTGDIRGEHLVKVMVSRFLLSTVLFFSFCSLFLGSVLVNVAYSQEGGGGIAICYLWVCRNICVFSLRPCSFNLELSLLPGLYENRLSFHDFLLSWIHRNLVSLLNLRKMPSIQYSWGCVEADLVKLSFQALRSSEVLDVSLTHLKVFRDGLWLISV